MKTKRICSILYSVLSFILFFSVISPHGMANGYSGGFTKGDWNNPNAMMSSTEAAYDDQAKIEAFDASLVQTIDEPATKIELLTPLNHSMQFIIKVYAKGCLGEGTSGFMSAEEYCEILPRFLSLKPGELLDLEVDSETGALKFLVFDEQSHDVVIKVLPN